MDEDDDDDMLPEVFTHFTFKTKVTRVIEDIIFPSTLNVKIEFLPNLVSEELELDVVFTKIRYWLDNIVDRSIVFANKNGIAVKMFIDEDNSSTRVANVLMVTPDEPVDQHLAALFQAKLQAIAGDAVEFGPIEVRSDNEIGLTYTFVGDALSVLPSMEEWCGTRNYFDKPWWARADGSTLDALPPEGADLTEKPAWAFTLDFLERPRMDPKTTGVIVRPEFRPTIIDGGKDKDK